MSVQVQCSDKPAEADKYGFSNFARMLMRGKGLNPLPSDSRRRPDRTALEVSCLCNPQFLTLSRVQRLLLCILLSLALLCVQWSVLLSRANASHVTHAQYLLLNNTCTVSVAEPHSMTLYINYATVGFALPCQTRCRVAAQKTLFACKSQA